MRKPRLFRTLKAITTGMSTPALLLAAAMIWAPSGSARADIIKFVDGSEIKGLTRDLPSSPDQLEYTGARGTLRIQRSRIASVIKETPAQGWIHIGSEHLTKEQLPDALAAFKQALDLEPDNAAARGLIDQAQAAIAERDRMSRQDALKQIDEMAAQARKQVAEKNFEQAEKLYQDANKLVPSDEQKMALVTAISDMYYQWGQDRLDRLDPNGAEARFNLAVEASRENTAAINELLKLWEGRVDKREQAANIYETILERHPENSELRKKLGDLYGQMGRTEDMVHHYLELYKQSDQWVNTPMERQLIEGLDKLHNQYAREKEYDKAIKTYELLATLDPTTDATAVIYYQYLKQANQVKPDDLKGRLALAQFAEQNGLDQEALDKYRGLLGEDATRQAALAGLSRYAARHLSMAQTSFNNRNFSLARTLADQVRKDFPQVPEAVETASEIIGKSQAEEAREQRLMADRAKDMLTAANEYYAQANQHFNNLFSTERRNNPLLMSDRQEAKRYYTLAISAYQQVLQLNPSLARDPTSLVVVRLNESRTRLASLSQSPTGGIGEHTFQFRYNQSTTNPN
jgi:tetratricopeptide (TPR) repeat protein